MPKELLVWCGCKTNDECVEVRLKRQALAISLRAWLVEPGNVNFPCGCYRSVKFIKQVSDRTSESEKFSLVIVRRTEEALIGILKRSEH